MPKLIIMFSENEIQSGSPVLLIELNSGKCQPAAGQSWPDRLPRRMIWLLNALQDILIEYKKRREPNKPPIVKEDIERLGDE